MGYDVDTVAYGLSGGNSMVMDRQIPSRDGGGGTDNSQLRRAFYRSFDRNLCLARILDSSKGLMERHRIGAGGSFKAYLLRERDPHQIPLVLKVPQASFLAERHFINNDWFECMDRLNKQNLPLVPPIEVIRSRDHWGYILPFGEPYRAKMVGLRASYETLTKELAYIGMQLGDLPQIRCWRGLPFIVDWSDLLKSPRVSSA